MRPGRLAMLLLALPALGCAIAPPPPEPDPIQGATRREGEAPLPDAAQAASCVSQRIPASMVVLRRAGAAVRPAPGTLGPGRPDFALLLDRPGTGPLAWRLLVDGSGPAADATAQALDGALGDCVARLGGTA